jgi:hypothetical protein
MTRAILVPGPAAVVSLAEAIEAVQSMGGTVVAHDSSRMLVDIDVDVSVLRERLLGWTVSVQGGKIPVPDTRLKVRRGPSGTG